MKITEYSRDSVKKGLAMNGLPQVAESIARRLNLSAEERIVFRSLLVAREISKEIYEHDLKQVKDSHRIVVDALREWLRILGVTDDLY